MSKPKSKAVDGRVTLKYIGPGNRTFKDLPTLEEGATVVVDSNKAKSLLATKHFVKVTPKAASTAADKE